MNMDSSAAQFICQSVRYSALFFIPLSNCAGTVDPMVFLSVVRTICTSYAAPARIPETSSMNMDSSLSVRSILATLYSFPRLTCTAVDPMVFLSAIQTIFEC
jgi:hypothetical protein